MVERSVPVKLQEFPIGKLLKLHERHRVERRQFRERYLRPSRHLGQLRSREALLDAIKDCDHKTQEAVRRQKEILDEAAVESVWTALSLSSPRAVSVVAAAIGFQRHRPQS